MKNSRFILPLALAATFVALPVTRAADLPPAGERRERFEANADRLAERLGLNDEQRTKIKAINEQEKAELATLSPEQRKTQGKEIHQKYREQREAVMTPEQRAKAEKMRAKGEKWRDRKERREQSGS